VVFENVDFIYADMQHIALHQLKEDKRYGTIAFKDCRFERGQEADQFLSNEGPHHQRDADIDAERLIFCSCSIDSRAQGKSVLRGGPGYGIDEVTLENLRSGDRVVAEVDDLVDFGIELVNIRKVTIGP